MICAPFSTPNTPPYLRLSPQTTEDMGNTTPDELKKLTAPLLPLLVLHYVLVVLSGLSTLARFVALLGPGPSECLAPVARINRLITFTHKHFLIMYLSPSGMGYVWLTASQPGFTPGYTCYGSLAPTTSLSCLTWYVGGFIPRRCDL